MTLYIVKRFTSGLLSGITIYETVTGSLGALRRLRIGATGRSRFGSRGKWVIVDASFQSFKR